MVRQEDATIVGHAEIFEGVITRGSVAFECVGKEGCP